VAALMVALSHCLLVLTVDGIDNIWFARFGELNGLQSTITRSLLVPFNGGAAVTVFFVLSGYVLGLSLDRHRQSLASTAGFYLKRIFRLYPAHIVTLLGIVASLLLFHEYRAFEAGSAWYAEWYRNGLSLSGVLSNLALKQVYLNHIAWTLQVELAGSLFLPLAWLVNRHLGLWPNLLVLGLLIGLSWWSSHLLLIFLYCFYAGLMLPQLFERLESWLAGGSGQILLAAGIALLCLGYTLAGPASLFGRVLLETLGGVLIIAHLIHQANAESWLNRFLSQDVINRLGRYSYSFYLLHFIILYWIAYVLLRLLSPELLLAAPLLFGFGMMVVSVPITFWLSGLMYRNVEVPMISAAKKLVGDAWWRGRGA
jgi:peptidoglycan/LPS O-acetylase OafA/YrhL